MKSEDTPHQVRIAIESVNNFLKKQKETRTRQLNDDSEGQRLGDPLTDVKMNQMANDLGSDGQNAPAITLNTLPKI
jgi:hypothetical protein